MALPYDDSKLIKAQMKPSPSLLANNLCLSGNKELAYAHRGQIVMVGFKHDGSPCTTRKISSKHGDAIIYSLTACYHHEACYLVACTEVGIQIWDKSCSNLLYSWTISENAEKDPIIQSFARAAAINVAADGTAQICIGTTSGEINVFAINDVGKFKHLKALSGQHKTPIAALGSTYQSRRGIWAEDLACKMASADDAGVVVVWSAESASAYTSVLTIDSNTVPVTSLAVRGEFVMVARIDGKIGIYGMNDGRIRSELTAHSRWACAMELHPTRDLLLTAAQDSSIAIWNLPIIGKKFSPLLSTAWLCGVPTGVAFCGPANDDVAVVAYDTEELRIFPKP